MNAVAEQKPEVEVLPPPFIRRYQTADIVKHAAWLFPRMARAFPHMSREAHYTWLLNVVQNNDILALYHDHGIAIATITRPLIGPDERIEEVFVFVETAADPEQMRAGGHFYVHFYEWAVARGVKTVLVENNTDISRKAILEATGRRVFEAKLSFMRARE